VYNSKKYLYSLCEVNYRKTLGLFIHELKKFIPDQSGIGKWIIIKSDKNISKFSQLLDVIKPELFNQNTNIGIIPTSPVGNLFYSFFLSYPDYSILNRKEEWLRKVLKKRV